MRLFGAVNGTGCHGRTSARQVPHHIIAVTRQRVKTGRTVARATDDDGPKFSLEESITLAAAAFESYLEPEREKGLKDVALNGTTTQYLSRTFAQETFTGVLKVTVVRACSLTAADPTGKSDPYVIVSCGESSGQTSWKLQTLEPEWNETFHLWMRYGQDTDRLRVRVCDKDFLTADDDLGTVYVGLDELESNTETELELELRGGKAGNGRVTVKLTVMPFVRESQGSQELLDTVAESRSEANAGNESDLLAEASEAAQGILEAKEQQQGPADKQMQQAWAALAELYYEGVLTSNERVAFIESPETDTQVWIFRDKERKRVTVAFRGTEQIKWKDLVTDMNLAPADLNIEGVQQEQNVFDKLIKRTSSPTVHSGFYNAWLSVRQRVIGVVDACTGGADDWHIFVTGHSLGGALATLAAYTFASRKRVRNPVTMYNYGSPRVGNKAFAEEYNALVPDSWRVHNSVDVVAAVPRLMGYSHVRNGVRITEQGKLVMLDAQGVDVWGEGTAAMELFEELQEHMSSDSDREQFFEKVLQHELELLESLKDGQALSQHMEDFYLESLCAIISDATQDEEVQAVLQQVREALVAYREACAEAAA